MIIASLLKAFFYYLVAGLFVTVLREKEQIYMVGSEYGNMLDRNAYIIAENIKSKGGRVVILLNNTANILEEHQQFEVMQRGSFASFKLFFKSKGVFYSHSISDVLPYLHYSWWLLNIIPRPKLIFIQHGIIGLKVNQRLKVYLKRQERCFDYMTAASKLEQKIIYGLGVPREKVIVTGLARYDLYNQDSQCDNKRILVFLTWDTQLERYDQKCASIKACLNALGLIEGYDYDVIHHNMMKSRSIGVKSVADEFNVLEYSTLITDQSSVAWDFFYLGRRVIFFQPFLAYSDDCKLIIDAYKATSTRRLEKLLMSTTVNYQEYEMFEYFDQNNAERVIALAN